MYWTREREREQIEIDISRGLLLYYQLSKKKVEKIKQTKKHTHRDTLSKYIAYIFNYIFNSTICTSFGIQSRLSENLNTLVETKKKKRKKMAEQQHD